MGESPRPGSAADWSTKATDVAEHARVIRVTRFKPAPGKGEELAQKLETLSESVRPMEGCFGVQVCSVREAPEVVVVISRWASQSALDKLMSTGTQDMAQISGLLAEPPKAEHFEPL